MTHNTILNTYPQITKSYNPSIIIQRAKKRLCLGHIWEINILISQEVLQYIL